MLNSGKWNHLSHQLIDLLKVRSGLHFRGVVVPKMLLNVCLCRVVQAWLDLKEKRATLLASRWVEFVVPVLDSENNPALFIKPLCCSFSGSSWTSWATRTPRRVQLPQRSKNAHITLSDSFLSHPEACLFDLCAHCPSLCLCFLKTVFPIPPRPHCKMPVSFYFPHAIRFMRKNISSEHVSVSLIAKPLTLNWCL